MRTPADQEKANCERAPIPTSMKAADDQEPGSMVYVDPNSDDVGLVVQDEFPTLRGFVPDIMKKFNDGMQWAKHRVDHAVRQAAGGFR